MRDRRAALIGAGAGLAAHLLLLAGALGGVPPMARLWVAFLALILVPGFALVRLTSLPPGGPLLAAGWALGLGVAWNGALVLVTRALGAPFTVLAGPVALVASAALWAVALVRGRSADSGAALPARWAIVIVVTAVVAAWHGASLGPPLTTLSDSPDHLGTIRRMLASGDAFPTDAFFRDAGAAGADPRKGLWHPQVALIARLAAVDPLLAWRGLTGALAALFVLNIAALGMLIGGAASAAVAALALLFTYGSSLAQPPLREAVFATKLADQLALTAIVAVLADLAAPRRALRWAAFGLALGAVAAHVFAALQFAIVFAALGAGLLLRERRWTASLTRLTGTALMIGAACLPYLLWRAHGSYAPRNAIHTEPQGLLTLWDGVRIVSIGVLWDWMGKLWILFPLAWPALWRAGRGRPAVLYLLTTSVGVALLIFDPPVVKVLEPRVGYLLLRMIWMVPLAGLLAWMIPALGRRVRDGAGRARGWAAAGLAGVAVLMAPALGDGAQVLLHPGSQAALDRLNGPLEWSDAMEWMDRQLPAGRVVLSDPATSYAVPMMTRHYVVTLVDQHSSPNDSLALTRLLDARDALDPFATWDRTRAVIDRYGVDVIALNDRFVTPPRLDYWTPRHDWYVAARARFDAAPAAFERLYDERGFVIYRIHHEVLDTLSSPPRPRTVTLRFDPDHFPVARRIAPDVPALVSLRLDAAAAAPGDTIPAVALWRSVAPLAAGSYEVAVRFDRPLPGGFEPPAMLRKPARKAIERLRRERYRFRVDHLPTGGEYGVDLWRRDEVVRDSFDVIVPRDVAEGEYTVRIRMMRQPHYPNYHLSDYFFDDDYYAGLVVGELDINARRAVTGAGPGGH